jgi:hypothetical protein
MIDITNIKVGDKVRYRPSHYADNEWENGIVKEIRPDNDKAVFVVYKCDNNWKEYYKYTGCLTDVLDLYYGWMW